MPASVIDLHGVRVLAIDIDGPPIRDERDAVDLIGETFGLDVDWLMIPTERLDPSFFDLSTRHAGGFLQKLVNYRLKAAIVGDIETYLARSNALRDFVRESNAGTQLWFMPTREAFAHRLAPR
jgi:hypothetical protein